jgi:hypothetical protein
VGCHSLRRGAGLDLENVPHAELKNLQGLEVELTVIDVGAGRVGQASFRPL